MASKNMRKAKNKNNLENKQKKYIDLKSFLIKIFLPFLISFLSVFLLVMFFYPSKNKNYSSKTATREKINSSELKKYLKIEENLYFEPLELIDWLGKDDKKMILIDVRDKESFKKEHIKEAKNFQSIEEILKVTKINSNLIIIYGDYSNDLKTKTIAYRLLEKGFNVKILSVGYNEFRHLKILWLPQSLWDKINPEDFVEKED
jgi:rhodanese-related sulfurtransferase